MIVVISVLIVDDDPAFRRLARHMLAIGGFCVAGEATTVAEGRSAAGRLRPDAALVDVGLPDGDGIELARELVTLAWAPKVLLTSTDADAVADGDERAGIAFVPKAELPNAPLRRLLGPSDEE